MSVVISDPGMDALLRGNGIRTYRAGLKRRLRAEGRAGAATAARLLLRNPEPLRSLDVGEMLLMVHFFGKTEARRLLERHHISPWCPVDELSDRSRRLLAADLEAFAIGLRPRPRPTRGNG